MALKSEIQVNNGDDSGQTEQDDALLPRPELPPRMTATVQRSSRPYVSNQNIFTVLMKNIRQITSLTAGLIVLLGSGVHTVWAFWQVYSYVPSSYTLVIVRDLLMIGSWYITSIIGTAIAAVLLPNWSKKLLYIVSAILLFLSSLFFIGQIILDLRYDSILLAGRVLGGLANGIAYLTVITHAAENAVNQIRGVILRGIGYVLAFSLFIAGATTSKYLSLPFSSSKSKYIITDTFDYSNTTTEYIQRTTEGEEHNKTYNDFETEFIMGILNLFYSVLAILAACHLTIESAPHLLRRVNDGLTVGQREAKVIETMIKLRSEKGETPKIRNDFIEMKHQLNEDQLDPRSSFGRKNLRPLLIIIGVRVLSVCAKNLPFSVAVMLYFNHLLNAKDLELELLFMLLFCRFALGMFTMFFIDKFECKKFLYICSILSGILMLNACFLILFGKNPNASILDFEPAYSIGMIVFFVFGSMSIDCVGHVQASEAFSYATKSWSITIANTIEHAVHLVFIVVFKFELQTMAFGFIAIGLVVFGISTLLTVPAKTKGLSLRQTRDIYRKVQFVLPRENV